MAKKREGIRCKTRIKHQFTTDEFRAKTMEKNKLEREAELKEEQRASANATFKAEIKAIQSEVADLRNQLDDGGELRDVDATVVMDRKKGTKAFYRFCPGQPGHDEKLKVENMTQEDFEALPFQDQEVKPPDGELEKSQEVQQ